MKKRTEKIEEQQQEIAALLNQNKILFANNEKLQQQLTFLLSTVSDLDKKVQSLADVQNNSTTVVKR